MIDVKTIVKNKGSQTGGGSYSSSVVVPGNVTDAQNAKHANEADNAQYAEKAGYAEMAGEAVHADTATRLSDDSGVQLYQDEQGNWHFETDYIHANMKLTAKELQIEEVKHVGGQQLLTAASMSPDYVRDNGTSWRCYWKKVDSNGKEITNKWVVGDLAYVSTFNLGAQAEGVTGNHFLWRAVVDTDNINPDSSTIYIEQTDETIDMSEYHYIDLSKADCAAGSDAPLVGDDIVQLGNRSDADRSNAIIIAGAGTGSPYIRQFTGITDYHLPEPDTQIKPGDNLFTGKTKITGGTFPDGTDLEKWWEALAHGDDNMILNSGFTGEYDSINVDGDTQMEIETPVYSPQLDKWTAEGEVEVIPMDSQSGYGVSIEGTLLQTVGEMEDGQMYTLIFKAKGDSLTVSLGDWSYHFDISADLKRYRAYIVLNAHEDTDLEFAGNFELCEPRLSRGNVASDDWARSNKDSDEAKAVAQAADYVLSAIRNGNTTILGGLILSQLLKVGNYRNGEMTQETGGMSGLYTSEHSPFLWGGGDLEQAFFTIGKYKTRPDYQPNASELANMAKFVVTHGGRAILNDIVLRGYIYAEGGVFKNVQSPNGNWKIDESGNVSVNGTIKATGGFGMNTEIVDCEPYGVSNDSGLVIIQSTYDNIYMPQEPVNGQQIVMLNPANANKTLKVTQISGHQFVYSDSGGTVRHSTFPLAKFMSATFVYVEGGDWYVISQANFLY